MMTRMRKDKLLDEQLVRLDARAPLRACGLGCAEGSHREQAHDGASYEYALVHGEKDQAESIRRRMNKLTEKI